jgi:hypothetical protein
MESGGTFRADVSGLIEETTFTDATVHCGQRSAAPVDLASNDLREMGEAAAVITIQGAVPSLSNPATATADSH